MRWKITCWFLAFFTIASLYTGISNAADDAVQTMSEAYASYRMSSSYIRAGNTDLGDMLLQQFIDKWTRLADAWSQNPPDQFAKDPKLKTSLEEILRTAKDADAALQGGDATKATEILGHIRSAIADLRRRNGVRTLSDCIDEISAQMDALWKLREGQFDSHDSSQAKGALDIVETLKRIIDRCGRQTPANNKEQFERLLHQASSSLEDARQSIDEQDTDRFIRIVRELHAIDNILFQQFD